jgi:hypothetical protein
MIKNRYHASILKNPDWLQEQFLMARGEFGPEREIAFEKHLKTLRHVWVTYGARPANLKLF